MSKIYLVRHAESIANTQGIYQGVTYDTDLSALGKKQAEALAKIFQNIKIDTILASPLKRTYDTAQSVGKLKKTQVLQETAIIETNHGEWEGKHKHMIRKTWPKLYKKWQKFPSSVHFPGGEDFLDTQKRVLKWWQELCQNHVTDMLVVSHVNIIQIIIANILNTKLNRIWKFPMQPTAVSHIEVSYGLAKLLKLNDASHLGNLQVNLTDHAL
ncbi:MAG: histidine phosphatase family protein [Patescibacteria group bacterium]